MSAHGLRSLWAFLSISSLVPAVAVAQPTVFCTALAAPLLVDSSGVAEPVSDILLRCEAPTAADPGRQPDLVMSLAVRLNVGISTPSRSLGGVALSDAVVEVNEQACPEAGLPGSGNAPCPPRPGIAPESRGGVQTGASTIEWPRVRVPFPGSLPESVLGSRNPRVATVRIRGILANASQLRLLPGSSGPGPPVSASLTIRSTPAVSLRNATLSVAQPLPGLQFAVDAETEEPACTDGRLGQASVRLWEAYPASLRSDGEDGRSGPSRVMLDFWEIPAGVGLSLPVLTSCGSAGGPDSLTMAMVVGHDDAGAGGEAALGSDGLQSVAVQEGRARAVYEVVSDSPVASESCSVPALLGAQSDRAFQARMAVSAGLAPRGRPQQAGSEMSGRRFAAPLAQARQTVEFPACRSALLFPFVTNQAGFDTGLTIANVATSGLSGTTGACSLHFYGVGAEGQDVLLVQTTTPIASGEQLLFTFSGGNPSFNIVAMDQFQGYVIADCGFPAGRGYAFLSDGFGSIPDLAMGYRAPVIPLDSTGRRLTAARADP